MRWLITSTGVASPGGSAAGRLGGRRTMRRRRPALRLITGSSVNRTDPAFPGIRAENRLLADRASPRSRLDAAELRPRVSRIPVFRPPGKPQPPGQVLVAPLAVVGHRVEGAAGSVVEHGSARPDEGQVEVLVERPFSRVLELRQGSPGRCRRVVLSPR